MTTAKGNKQPLNLRMDSDVINQLKRYSLDRGRTVSDVVTELVVRHLEQSILDQAENGSTAT